MNFPTAVKNLLKRISKTGIIVLQPVNGRARAVCSDENIRGKTSCLVKTIGQKSTDQMVKFRVKVIFPHLSGTG